MDMLVLNNIMPVTNDNRLSRTLLYMRTYTASEKKPNDANNDIKLYISPNLRDRSSMLYPPLIKTYYGFRIRKNIGKYMDKANKTLDIILWSLRLRAIEAT